MDEFNELAGRIDGVAQAVLRVVATLERAQLLDGAAIAAQWRAARPAATRRDAARLASARVLEQMAEALDDAHTAQRKVAARAACRLLH